MADAIRVLYVDDEPLLLELATTFLEEGREFSVSVALSGKEALATLSGGSFDAVVSDYQMAGMDGIAFLKTVRERFGDLPFILFTGRGREEVGVDAHNNGADFYLQKGGEPDAQFAELAHKIRQAVFRQRAQAELREAYDRLVASEAERAKSEQQAQESEEKFRDLANRLPQMVFETDIGLRITYVNQYTVEKYGFPAECLAERIPVLSFIHPAQHDQFMESFHNLKNGIPFEPREYTVIGKDGTPFPVIVYSSPIFRNKQLAGFRGVAVDLTERKRAEEDLFASRQMLQCVLDTIPQRVFWKDRNLVFLGCNKPLARDIGYADPAEVVGKTDYDHSSAAIAEHFRDDDRAVMESGQPKINFEEPQIRPDGSVSWLRTSKVPLRNQAGEIIGVLGTYEDITEAKKATEAIFKSASRYRDLADLLPQMVFETDRDLRITYINRHAAAVLGYAEEELSGGMPILSLVDPREHTLFRKHTDTLLTRQPARPSEFTAHRKDGSTFPVVVSLSPVVTDGEVTGFRGVAIDISGWKILEDGIRESEAKFRSLVENASDIIFSLDPQGNVTYVSPQWVESLGYDPGGLARTSVADVIHPADLPRNIAAFREAMSNGTRVHGLEYRVQHQDGTWRWHSQNAAPVRNAAGAIVAYQGICHDITERKRAEEALRQAHRKLSLLSGITRHDITNQLTTLAGYIKLLERKIPDATYAGDFARIRAISGQIATLIQFTREYEEIGVHAPAWQDARALADAACQAAESGTVAWANDLPGGLMIFADPLIAKVFSNLVDNALRHGKTISRLRFFCPDTDNNRVIVCEDDGVGVAADIKERIFEPGFGKNTGFGLALTREILDITGIAIRETGTPGSGARFEIIVPAGQFRVQG